MIYGDTRALKESVILQLEKLYHFCIQKDEFLPGKLIVEMAVLTSLLNKELAVYLNREGKILNVTVGNYCNAVPPEIYDTGSKNLFSAVRCIQVRPDGSSTLSSADIDALLSLKLDGMIAVGVQNGKYTDITAAIPVVGKDFKVEKADLYGPFMLGERDFSFVFKLIKDLDNILASN